MKEQSESNGRPPRSGGARGTDLLLAAGLVCLFGKPRNRKGAGAAGKNAAIAPNAPVAAAEPPGPEAVTAAPPEFRLCLLTPSGSAPREAAPAWRGALASALVHGVSVAGLITAGSSGVSQPGHSYHLEVLHIQQGFDAAADAEQLWNSLHPAGAPRVAARRRAAKNAPQTIVVAEAPPDVTVNEAVPAPLAVSVPQPPETRDEAVRLSEPSQPAVGEVNADAPKVAVLSLPQPDKLAADAVVLPRVSQTAGGSSESGDPDASQRYSGRARGEADAPGSEAASGTSVGADVAGIRAPDARAASRPAAARIELPADGRPRVSVLGESPYMPGFVVATIYLKIGVPRDWILEYWIPGGATALTAPWPYVMLRPPVRIPALAETVLVRGHLTAEGLLEQLCPADNGAIPDQAELFDALSQWKFRPAARNGNPVAVEILLVIPRQPE